MDPKNADIDHKCPETCAADITPKNAAGASFRKRSRHFQPIRIADVLLRV